ncbi:Flagellar motor switch protein FliM [Buchnera aphidicola (Cinara pseudotaxifoliae)]|uniref:Flagellar motor switch protein FliM n=1 Tax=Buchnera aphidicola (Cinara pseudotaxifoliae) TaxID=655384 RepID=A0A451DG82_9GAMM|nr:hypothetical protein [Buchnera aphidicola]VFP85626.1 Flagellar motor switch protein FliM [Buchnera aphidicola (Cinara pseudotaxifoliae)]
MSKQSDFVYKKSAIKILHHKNFINFVLAKQKLFFKKLFCDFCFLFQKQFNKIFYCNIDIDFCTGSVEYNSIYLNQKYLKFIGKSFFLDNYSNECLVLISRFFASMFIGNMFGNCKVHVDVQNRNLKLTKNEMYVLDGLLEKIFFIFNETFLKKISSSVINTGQYIQLDSLLSNNFIYTSYVCFTFLIYINNHKSRLKIYFPRYIVGDLQK